VLHFILELLTLKAKYGWSDGSFNDLLRILAWLLPKPNKVPANTYRAKKLVSPFTIGMERIHACANHCILYHGDTFKNLKKYLVFSGSRYKNNVGYYGDDNQGPTNVNKRNVAKNIVASVEPDDATLGIPEKQSRIPAMVMWYLPISNRLRRFFSNLKDAELKRWWDSDKRKKGDGKLRHPADAQQWKEFDEKYYLEFGNDLKNVRFPLSMDGMNLFGERSSTHNTWPVILTMYNLPTWLC
jgi:hypothetical protein